MISLIIPYFLTWIGIIIGGVHDFTAMAVLLTAVGIIWTAMPALLRNFRSKGF